MDTGHSRRTVMKLMAGAGIAAGAALAGRPATAQQYGVDSGGIGLLRRDFEAAYGNGLDAQHLTIYEDVDVGMPATKMYTQFQGDVVSHIEVRWSLASESGGADWRTATEETMFLLPVDATLRDQYFVPSTPEGPTELMAHVYESAQLNEANHSLGRVLVIFQRDYAQLEPDSPVEVMVPAVTLTMVETPQ